MGERPNKRWWVLGLLALTSAMALSSVVRDVARRATAPKAWKLRDFARAHAQPRKLRRVQVSGLEYVVWLDRASAGGVLLRIGSGAPVYIFDATGILVAWSPTTGDGECAVFLGAPFDRGVNVTIEEAISHSDATLSRQNSSTEDR